MILFLVLMAFAHFTQNGLLLVLALLSFVIGFIYDVRSDRSFFEANKQFRKINSQRHPEIFDDTPPEFIDNIHGEFVDMYDLETGLFIGCGLKRDIQTLYDAFENDPLIFENGKNDIPLIQDIIEQVQELEDFELTPHFLNLMNNAMDEERLTLVTIRWVEPSQSRSDHPT